MYLSFSTTLCPEASLSEAIQLAQQAGFDQIELFRTRTRSSPVDPNISVPMVRRMLDSAGIRLSGLNIRNITGKRESGQHDPSYNLRQVEWDIHLARALKLNNANTKGGDRSEQSLKDLIEGVNTLLNRIPDITLNLGNHHGNRLENLSDYRLIMPDLDSRARILLDTGHLLTAGEDILKFADTFANRIGVVHLRDQVDDHPVPFGKGNLPFDDLMNLLKQVDYRGPLVVELENVDWASPVEAAETAHNFVESLLMD